MKSKYLAGALVLVLVASASPAGAQTPSSSSPATAGQLQARKELERKTLLLLDDIIKDAQSFRLAENRLHLKAVAASLLWKHDEARARTLFRETMAGIIDLLNSQAEADAPNSRFLQGAAQLWREVVQMLAQRDARMAREFLRASQDAYTRQAKARGEDVGTDLQLEYSLATQITDNDPQQALELAEENLAKGLSYELVNTLQSLRAKDPAAAAKLAGEIMAKLRSENLLTNQEAAQIATAMLDMVFNAADPSADKEAKKSTPLLDEEGIRQLLEINLNLALKSPNYSGQLRVLEKMMPQVERYAPGRVAELRRRLSQFKGADGGEEAEAQQTPDWAKYQALMEKGTAEDVLAAAAKAPQGMREILYQLAASKYAEQGEVDRAREVVNNHISNPEQRRQLLEGLNQQASLTAAAQGEIAEVRKSLQNLRTNEERALALVRVAGVLTSKGEKRLARQVLDEAQGFVNTRARNIRQLGAQLLVAQGYIKLEPARTLQLLEPIVDQLNELLAAAVMLGGFILDEEVMRDDEIRFEIFTEVLPMLTGPYTLDLQTLAAFDFERTRSLADRFQRDEVRMMARLLVVQSVLGEQAPASPQSRGPEATTLISEPTVMQGEDGAP